MKLRKVAVLTLALSLMGGSVIFADSITQKARVTVNGQEVSDGAVVIDGKTYISASQAGDSLGAIVDWDADTKKLTITKPDVNILPFAGKVVFGGVKRGEFKFNVICTVDNLKIDADAVKVSIIDPSGKVKDIQELELKERKENFVFQTPEISYDFKTAGSYTIAFYVKPTNSSSYTQIAKKEIVAL